MTPDRPPQGGLFRLSGPVPPAERKENERAEAHDAIRHFVRVLERLDRDVQRLGLSPQRSARPRSVAGSAEAAPGPRPSRAKPR
ncbi:MAG: hypothetical protein HEQ16_07885 [Bosea sp.]|jgi:hypothetical protein|nr:hypothetical protein [Bosea sp. (in: a-proteobacteria)]